MKNPVHWQFTSRQLGPQEYELHLIARVDAPWHIYSQHTQAGGPVPTEINFAKNPMAIKVGATMEKGDSIKRFEDVFGVNVCFYNDSVRFVQRIQLKAPIKTFIGGTIRYMVCNDGECLAPKTIPFKIELGK